ncbi:MAG: family 1 glycosylhydrolase [Candidatus Dependentiae bacterium]|nr:family 1 glycosylhydrolase [Candidatus Dependentiae bacterium]
MKYTQKTALHVGIYGIKPYSISTISLLALLLGIPHSALHTQTLDTQTYTNYQQTVPKHFLQKCPPHQEYNPQSFEHEYICDAQELAQQFSTSLGSDKEYFLIGASTSEHQCSQKCTPTICDWSRFAHKKKLKQPTDHHYSGNFWDNYKTYIDQLKNKVGINTLRISIEWPLVQPENHTQFDTQTLDHYADVVAYLIKKDITPIICFHHYTSPCWFADRGGFEKRKNCAYFAHYCAQTYQYITEHLASQPSIYQQWIELTENKRGILWATFNSPEGVAFKGYRQQEGPPATNDKNGLYWVSHVLKNIFESHVQAYQYIKSIAQKVEYTPDPQIGFLKNITQFDPAPNLPPFIKQITQLGCAIANDLNNECIYSFFTNGTFCTKTPFTTASSYNELAPQSLDWIGLNYYSHQQMRLFSRVIAQENDENATDNINYRIYPHGLFRALAEINDRIASPLAIPIYVTENGIATQDHTKRNTFYKNYLHELLRAIQHGIPVHGYLTWTAFDNYEWPKTKTESHKNQSDNRYYGLTTVSLDGKELTLKPGAEYFKTFATSLVSA